MLKKIPGPSVLEAAAVANNAAVKVSHNAASRGVETRAPGKMAAQPRKKNAESASRSVPLDRLSRGGASSPPAMGDATVAVGKPKVATSLVAQTPGKTGGEAPRMAADPGKAPPTEGHKQGLTEDHIAAAHKAPVAPRMIRDSFTMPEAEYEKLEKIKKTCRKAGYKVKKSELLRIGLSLISEMDVASLKDRLAALPGNAGGGKNQD